MLAFDQLIARATAETKPFRWVIVQSTCRACGSVHEAQPVLMREHAPDSFIKVLDEHMFEEHAHAPVAIRAAQLAWCEHCRSQAAAELTRDVKEAVDKFGNTTSLEKALREALSRFEVRRTKEKFHHA